MGRHGVLVWFALLGCLTVTATALAVVRTGTAKGERIVGTNGNDVLKGLSGADNLIGKGGRDVLIGGGGKDSLHGDGGRDSFNMRAGKPLAAPGRDRIYARDGHPDEINCGAGRDLAVVDLVEDGVFDCEVVVQP
jgi:Ca2+-binding RTX toxin-like protein